MVYPPTGLDDNEDTDDENQEAQSTGRKEDENWAPHGSKTVGDQL